MWILHLLWPDAALASGLLVLIVLVIAGIWASEWISRLDENPDPSYVVIDEVAGQLLCLIWIPVSLSALILGFLLFRLFDIVKPFPANRLDNIDGGIGIMGDDLVAGLYAGASLYLIHAVFMQAVSS